MKTVYDYIVVGSGPTGAMTAQTLTESGADVAMLDAGISDDSYERLIPDKDFLSIRRSEDDQYNYFTGKDLEAISWGEVGKGEQITPPRKYMIARTDELTPVHSDNFSPVESLGYGGLGSGWGVGVWKWSDNELHKAGMNSEDMQTCYQTVLDRIGVSASIDQAQDYTIGDLTGFQKSPHLDLAHSILYTNYTRQSKKMFDSGFIMGRAPLALLTENKDDRKKYAYKEMEFYSDKDQSAYRPWITINRLRKQKNFTYISHRLVTRFEENDQYTTVYSLDINSHKEVAYRARKLILCAGVFGTARIILRSQQAKRVIKLPLLCNPYSYVPCVQPRMLGKAAEKDRLGFAQLSLFLDEDKKNETASMASLYGYQSLMLFRLARQVPLGFSDARILLQYLVSGLVIMGIHHPDSPSKQKYLKLIKTTDSPTGDALEIHYTLSESELDTKNNRDKKYIRAVRRLGLYPLKKFNPGNGASIHYAGTLPFSNVDKPFTLTRKGKLHGATTVYVADGSGFRYLAAKGLTFTLMANAHLVAKGVLND